MDWTAAGRKLGEAITAEQSPDLPVWIFADNPYIGKAGEMKQGLTEVLEKQGFSYTIVPRGTDDTYRSVIEKTVYPGSGIGGCILGEEIAPLLPELYGVGND